MTNGPSIAAKSTATGGGLTLATAGKSSIIDLVSRDFASAPLDNQNDHYQLSLINNDLSGIGDIVFTANYVGLTGKYQASYVPTKAGTYTFSITLAGVSISGSPFTVIVLTGEPSAAQTTTNLTLPASTVAGTTFFFDITLKDLFGSIITAGKQSNVISIMAYFQSDSLFNSPISVPNLANWEILNGKDIAGVVQDQGSGIYNGQVTILKAATFTIDIRVNDVQISGSPFSLLTVNPTEVYAPQTIAASPPTTVISGILTTFKVQGRDFYGNNAQTLITTASSTTIQLLNANTGALVLTGSIADDALNAGIYDVSFTPTISGMHTLVIKIEGQHIIGSPFSITIDSGATTDLTKTTITTFLSQYKTGEYIEFLIEARDSYGNIRSASTSEVFIVTLVDSDLVEIAVAPVSNNNGTYTVKQLLSKVTTQTLSVKESTNTTNVASSPYTGIVVSPGNVVALKSVFNTAPTPITAGTLATFKVEGKDIYSNTVPTDNPNYEFFLSIYSLTDKTTTIYPLIYKFGLYETDITLTKSGSYSVIIGLIEDGGLRGTYYKTVSFYGAIIANSLNFHSGLTPLAYTQVDSTIDINANYLQVLSGMPTQFFSISWTGKLKAPHSGKFRFYIDSADYYTMKLVIGGETLIDLQASANGIIYTGQYYYADKVLDINTLYDITIDYSEKIGASQVRFYWESDQITKEIVPQQYLYNTLYSENTPLTVVIEPLPTSGTKVVVTGDYVQAVAGVQETISLEARDIYSNLQIHQSDIFTVILTHVLTSSTVTGVVTPTANGLYAATYTLPNQGEYSMAITVDPNGGGSPVTITGSPFTVTCSDSLTDPAQTVLTGAAMTNAIAGQVMSFTVTLYDTQGNVRTAGGDTVVMTLKDGGSLSVGSTWVIDNQDGTYTAQYQHGTIGSYTIEIVVNSDTLNTKSSLLTISPGLPDPTLSTLTHPSTSTIGTSTTIDIVASDAFGNLITSTAHEIAYEVVGNHKLLSGTVAINSLPAASYRTSYTIPAPSGTDSSTCGTLGVNAYFVYQGLLAKYYANRWFSGTPAITKVEAQINVNWNQNEIIPGVSSDYVSVVWTGYLKPLYTEDYTFTVRSNDGVKVTIGDTVVINQLTQTVADGSSLTSTSPLVSLTANSFVPIKVEYYEITGDAFVFLEWTSASQSQEIIPATQFYSPEASALPITGSTVVSSSIYSPMKIISVTQGVSTTYAANSLTIEWKAPTDYGCSAITGYDVTLDDGIAVTTTVGVVTSTTITSLTPGQAYLVTVQAINSVNTGIASAAITLTPSILPIAPASISVSLYEQNALTLTWPIPTDTGIGDTSVAITQYRLEVDQGYGDGFVILSEQTTLSYKHGGLIAGHTYKYRVSAQNFLGYGPVSTEYSFMPIVVPAKPTNPPTNIASLTTQTQIHIQYTAVEDDGGSPVTQYNIYIDDGNDGPFGPAIANGLSLTYDTSALSLVSGKTYRFKYSAVNSQGEGNLSNEVAILLAELPGQPQNFARIDEISLSAGTLRIKWEVPLSNGGTAITGYNIYQDDKLIYKATNTEYTLTIYSLTIGTSYKISVKATNAVGEGITSDLTLIAASVPAKMSKPTRLTSSTTTIKVQWTEPLFNGGVSITDYMIRRDNGPGTAFQTAVSTSSLTQYEFIGLLNSVLTYRIQVAAVNSIGTGEYSTAYEFYAAATPSAPATFVVVSQSTTQISLDWTPPTSNGG